MLQQRSLCQFHNRKLTDPKSEKHETTHQSIQEEDPGDKKISERLDVLQLLDQDDVFDPGKTL